MKQNKAVEKTVQVRVFKDTRRQVNIGAAALDVSRAEFIRRAVARELAYNSKKAK